MSKISYPPRALRQIASLLILSGGDEMFLRIFTLVLCFFSLTIFGVGQTKLLRGNYSRIVPYVSTMEDVTKIYGMGSEDTFSNREFVFKTYSVNENIELEIGYFQGCDCPGGTQTAGKWIVDWVFFTFEEDLKLRPKNIIATMSDFKACPYGDIEGQIIYFNKERNITISYFESSGTVRNLRISATDEAKKKSCCNKNQPEWSLDPKRFRCNSDGQTKQ